MIDIDNEIYIASAASPRAAAGSLSCARRSDWMASQVRRINRHSTHQRRGTQVGGRRYATASNGSPARDLCPCLLQLYGHHRAQPESLRDFLRGNAAGRNPDRNDRPVVVAEFRIQQVHTLENRDRRSLLIRASLSWAVFCRFFRHPSVFSHRRGATSSRFSCYRGCARPAYAPDRCWGRNDIP